MLFHLRHPLTLDDCLWQYITDRGSRDCSVGALGLICSFHRLHEIFFNVILMHVSILLYVLFKVHKHGFNFMII